ncbi:putative membrane protein [Secundilactobacillus oryzae JCM 18671]|uniref:Putative membrane protein n=1 Tax=Secundilactobacillus oryzae JCM 18671 TaxID=1291743 RepID=A0A081BKM1_9LACO|nr:threonine/serine exporter family protein [Secundilactobacillus oryzae]GAK48589.1 putative membrane protein [Secundilactobacillus oryzae JCM 18671]
MSDEGMTGLSEVTAQEDLVVQVALRAGRIMIENGSEITRVEDTMTRIAKNAGVADSKLFVMITGIMMSITGKQNAQIEPVKKRTFDLEKISAVNDLSRQFAAHTIDLVTFESALIQLEKHPKYFPFWLQLIGAAMVSGPLELVFRQSLTNFPMSCVIGAAGWAAFYWLNRWVKVRFLSEFAAAILIGLLAIVAIRFNLGTSVDDIIIGGIMPLVPGVPITNSVRDTLAGNLVSGPARGVEALMSAAAIGFGIALVLRIM